MLKIGILSNCMAVLSLFEFWIRIRVPRVRLRRRLVTFDIVLSVYVIFYNFQSMLTIFQEIGKSQRENPHIFSYIQFISLKFFSIYA